MLKRKCYLIEIYINRYIELSAALRLMAARWFEVKGIQTIDLRV